MKVICKLYEICPYTTCPHAIEHKNCKMKGNSNCYGNCTEKLTTNYIRKQKLTKINDNR